MSRWEVECRCSCGSILPAKGCGRSAEITTKLHLQRQHLPALPASADLAWMGSCNTGSVKHTIEPDHFMHLRSNAACSTMLLLINTALYKATAGIGNYWKHSIPGVHQEGSTVGFGQQYAGLSAGGGAAPHAEVPCSRPYCHAAGPQAQR